MEKDKIHKKDNEMQLDKLLIAVSVIVVLGVVALLYLFPEASENVANGIF